MPAGRSWPRDGSCRSRPWGRRTAGSTAAGPPTRWGTPACASRWRFSVSATPPWGFAGGECQLLPCSFRDARYYGASYRQGNGKAGLGGPQPPALGWADVVHPLSPVSDFLRCWSGAAAVAPEIQPGPEEARALLNGSAVLPCRAEGWPVPRVTWRKDGRLLPLHGSDRYEALRVGDTKTRVSDHATLHTSRCFGVPGAGTALSLHEELRSVPTPAQQTRAACGCNGICHLPCPCALQPGRAEPPWVSFALPPQAAAPARRLPANRPRSGPGFGLLPLHGIQPCRLRLARLGPPRAG